MDAFDAVKDDTSFDGWYVHDEPWVRREHKGKTRSVDQMLTKLRRRLRKSGRLDEYKERQYYTKPSTRKREEREAQRYRAETGSERRQWRGG